MNNNHASEQALFISIGHKVLEIVLKLTKIKPITNNHYYATHVTMANKSNGYSGIFFKNYEINPL